MKKKKVSVKRNTQKRSVKKSVISTCSNADCKLRRKGCSGFEGCPGYKGK
jgi:hypothetical protein